MGKKRQNNGWGGARLGAGRKRKSRRRQVPHRARRKFSDLAILHVTVRFLSGLPSLRSPEAVRVIKEIFAKAVAEDRLAPAVWSIQGNHIHMIIEADSTTDLTKGMRSLNIRIAKALNKLWGRKGAVFQERYHARFVEGVFDTRNALRYVLLNHKKHGSKTNQIDWASSGPWFDGWSYHSQRPPVPPGPPPVAPFRSSMLKDGWCMCATLLDVNDCPSSTGRTARFKEV